MQKETGHALVSHLPVGDAVLADLLDDGLCHKKVGTYTKRYQPKSRLAAVSGTARMMPR